MNDREQFERLLENERFRFHKIAVFDIDGVMRGKYVDRDKLLSAVENGFGFCDVVMGWDSNDQLYDNTQASGWHTGYRDAHVSLDPKSARRIPFEEDTLLLLGQFSGSYASVCPRATLGRVIDRCRAAGFEPCAAFEYEFFLFDETPHSAREKGYRGLTPFTPGMFGYSMIRNSVHDDLYHEMLETMAALQCPIEGIHTETGPGVIEAALKWTTGTAAADQAAIFKTMTKVLAQRRGLMATFMAKWSNDYPGQSGHLHVSLQDAKGRNAFHDGDEEHGMSETMRHFVAGQVKYMPQLLAMACSTINAYRRLVPGMWAPTAANWGVENRTTSVRVIPAGPKGQRSEYRVAPADANPYLVLAAALASGLAGVEEGLELDRITEGNAYEQTPDEDAKLPADLAEATAWLRESTVARDWFGDAFVDHFCATRDWETRQARAVVTQWDLERYFEII